MTTGQRIKEARKKAGMTQSELAQKLNIPFQSVSQWERDIRNPKYETLLRIADALGVTYFDLLPVSGFDLSDYFPEQNNESRESSARRAHIIDAYERLNSVGQKEAVKRVEELTEIPRYQAGSPAQAAGDAPPPSPEGKDTIPPSPPPESP